MSKTRNMSKLARYIANPTETNTNISFTSELVSSSGSGTETFANISDLPLTGNTDGKKAFVEENNRLYIWDGTGWYNIALVNTSPTSITGADENYLFANDGTPIVLTLTSTDPEGIPLTWSYSVTSGSLTNGGGATATILQNDNVFTITPTTNQDHGGQFGLTFTASDGVNIATKTSLFELYFIPNVFKLGTSSTYGWTSGNGTILTNESSVQSRWGLIATGVYGVIANDDSGGFGYNTVVATMWDNQTDGVTIEWWSNHNTISSYWKHLFNYRGSTDSTSYASTVWYSGTGDMAFGTGNGFSYDSTAGIIPSANAWHHMCCIMSGTGFKWYVDGVLKKSTSYVSSGTSGSGAIDALPGKYGNLIITRGIKYTGNFTPPALGT